MIMIPFRYYLKAAHLLLRGHDQFERLLLHQPEHVQKAVATRRGEALLKTEHLNKVGRQLEDLLRAVFNFHPKPKHNLSTFIGLGTSSNEKHLKGMHSVWSFV